VIITRAPFRISFVGGGSDLKDYYSQREGAVLSTTINKYIYISSHYFFDIDKILIKYSKTEIVSHYNEIIHPIFREVLKQFNIKGALEISSNADVPAGSGLGSSSAFTVCLLHNMYTRFRKFISKNQLSEEACDIEINRLFEPIGKQDQYATAYGGLNIIRFQTSETVNIEPLCLNQKTFEKLQKNLLMFFIGNVRKTSSILTEQKQNMLLSEKLDNLKEMVSLVEDCKKALYSNDLENFGYILHKNWSLKQRLASKITDDNINSIYNKGLKAGAIGGKLLGAGAGGFLLFYCEEKHHQRLRNTMSLFPEMKFKFENEGAKIVYIGDEEYES